MRNKTLFLIMLFLILSNTSILESKSLSKEQIKKIIFTANNKRHSNIKYKYKKTNKKHKITKVKTNKKQITKTSEATVEYKNKKTLSEINLKKLSYDFMSFGMMTQKKQKPIMNFTLIKSHKRKQNKNNINFLYHSVLVTQKNNKYRLSGGDEKTRKNSKNIEYLLLD